METSIIQPKPMKISKLQVGNRQLVPNFLQKTYEILENPAFFHIVSWSDEGDALLVKDKGEFSGRILPNFFKHSNISSFIRQLNMYKFKKVSTRTEVLVFSHEMFLRGRRDLLPEIHRRSTESHAKTCQKADEPEIDEEKDSDALYKENVALKKQQKVMSEEIRRLDKQAKELTQKNEQIVLDMKIIQLEKSNNSASFLQPHHQAYTPFLRSPRMAQAQQLGNISIGDLALSNTFPISQLLNNSTLGSYLQREALASKSDFQSNLFVPIDRSNQFSNSNRFEIGLLPLMNLLAKEKQLPIFRVLESNPLLQGNDSHSSGSHREGEAKTEENYNLSARILSQADLQSIMHN